MDVTDVLKQARVLIKIGWCRNASAKDMSGKKVKMNDPRAVNFDLFAALHRASPKEGQPLRDAEKMLRAMIGGEELMTWNDKQKSKYAVLRLLDDAIDQIEGDVRAVGGRRSHHFESGIRVRSGRDGGAGQEEREEPPPHHRDTGAAG